MAVTYNVAVKTARLNAVRTYFDNGTIEIMAGASVLATFGLGSPPGSVTGAVWTLTPLDAGTVTATATGVANVAQIKNSAASAHLTGLTVGLSGADIILDNININSGQSVTMNSATITHAA